MNFENYNKIYKEILDDEKNELSANYLLNKYEIKHDEELLNILNQIKKNEYISSDNKIISKLIKELDENENLLDINEIINLKEKVIEVNSISEDNEKEEDKKIEVKIDTKVDKNVKTETSKKSKKTLEETKEKIKGIIIENISKKNPLIYALPSLVFLVIIFFVFSDKKQNEPILENKKIVKSEQKESVQFVKKDESLNNKVIQEPTNELDTINKEILASNEESILVKKELESKNLAKTEESLNKENQEEVTLLVENTITENVNKLEEENMISINEERTSEENLNIIEQSANIESLEELKSVKYSDEKVASLSEISKFIKEMKYEDSKIFFKDNYYQEKDVLLGFKIFKITPLYVKFEDQTKNIRKRFLFK